jgi:hypothetical protein
MTEPTQPLESARFESAIRRFDEENARDPNTLVWEGGAHPRELVYAQWLTAWVLKLCPDASESLLLAARCQHLCRWMRPRDSYPMTRPGYLQWREDLKHFHAAKAGEILHQVGYSETEVARVQALNLKKNFPQDPESRVLEDALCLIFLERQFAELAGRTPDDKMVTVLRKTWRKMTPAARALAANLSYDTHQSSLLKQVE